MGGVRVFTDLSSPHGEVPSASRSRLASCGDVPELMVGRGVCEGGVGGRFWPGVGGSPDRWDGVVWWAGLGLRWALSPFLFFSFDTVLYPRVPPVESKVEGVGGGGGGCVCVGFAAAARMAWRPPLQRPAPSAARCRHLAEGQHQLRAFDRKLQTCCLLLRQTYYPPRRPKDDGEDERKQKT